jgi:ligand-binding SRPBCC domain-containing protein
MQRFHLIRKQFLPLDIDATFAFFADANNLERITPPWLHFEVLTPRGSDLHTGSLIDYRLRLRGLPLRWMSEITVWEPPHRFADVQRRGPYQKWEHKHEFQPFGSGTLVQDAVVYAVPGGNLVNRFLVRPDLERIFDYRARWLNAWSVDQLQRMAT